MEKTVVDCIIVGQGLAGSCLAVQMLQRGKRIAVFDEADKNICSAVAAGLFNPVTGQKLVKTWKASVLFDYLFRFYPAVETMTKERFFYPMPLYRPFASVEEQNDWLSKTDDPAFAPFVDSVYTAPAINGIRDPLGGLLLRRSGFIDTKAFMAAVRGLLISHNSFFPEAFDAGEVQPAAGVVRYRQIQARQIVFCEGVGIARNPWFSTVEIRALKGETLRIKSAWREHVIVNRGVYMVPGKEPGEFKLGATYDARDTSLGTTDAARRELAEKLRSLALFDFTEGEQEWGLRPVTPDRRPVLGRHPEYRQMFVFNGLGTKGVSLAPYFSEVLFRGMEDNVEPGKEVDLSRF